ncbi:MULTISPECIES: hypothetical protein [Nostocales]|uniref:Uncharacterized protein n=3 Tax=Nostocales TaxID=1161 RepID=A0A8S9TA87_9CYAN|nr:hypothetical protein [Tolypothrix bouteillei]KAF3889028.1 hypothetical protein DA73_0400028785 [Tolypothrix bouteillei VB521301]
MHVLLWNIKQRKAVVYSDRSVASNIVLVFALHLASKTGKIHLLQDIAYLHP